MENFIVAVGCVTPMFLTLCVGLGVRRFHVVPEDMIRYLSLLSFRALLPFHLFYSVYSADLDTSLDPKLLAFLVGWTLVWWGAGSLYYTLRTPDPRRRGAYIQNFYRSNIAVIGVSLAQSMMGQTGVALMALAICVVVPTFNVLAVITLETCRGGKADLGHTVKGILTNPLIIGCVLGVLFLLLGIRLPGPVEKAVSNVGAAGSVMTLIALGASFQFSGVGKNARALVRCNLIRLVLAPGAALAAAWLLGLRGNALGIVLVCMGAPTASTSYPMAIACDSDYELTGQAVVTSSALCCFSMFLWIFLLKQAGVL